MIFCHVLRNKLFIFFKAQLSAFIGGLTDYGVMIFITEVFKVHYTLSIIIGGAIGAVVNFTINKEWTFNSKELVYKNSGNKRLSKFVFVVLNSIILKLTGTYFITSIFQLDYKISRIFIDLIVSVFFNYTLQRNWVFKNIE
ncbi:MAG: GtrA family protein [Ignavibacteriota bacterium]